MPRNGDETSAERGLSLFLRNIHKFETTAITRPIQRWACRRGAWA